MDNAILFRRFGRLLHATAGLTLVLVLVGAIVRSTGSGLGCGTAGGWHDWPLCHGQLIPPAAVDSIIEFSHRAFAAAVSLCMLGAAFWVAANRELRARFGSVVGAALALLILQIALGALTVRLLDDGEINPFFVVAHLATAFAFFGTLVAAGSHGLRLAKAEIASGGTGGAEGDPSGVPAPAKALALVTLALVFFQALLGGLVANLGASMACPEFPSCAGGVWVPALSGPVGLQVAHRLGAVVVSLMVVALYLALRRHAAAPKGIAAVAIGIVAIQFALGVAAVLLGLPLMARAAHHVFAYVLFGAVVGIAYGILGPTPGPARGTARPELAAT